MNDKVSASGSPTDDSPESEWTAVDVRWRLSPELSRVGDCEDEHEVERRFEPRRMT